MSLTLTPVWRLRSSSTAGPLRQRTRRRAACAVAALLFAGVLAQVPAAAGAQSAPGTPSEVTVTRGDGSVSASWPSVAGAARRSLVKWVGQAA